MKTILSSDAGLAPPVVGPGAVIWLLTHWPETPETDERVKRAVSVHERWGCEIWVYASSSAPYPQSVERLIKDKLVRRGVRPEAIVCSADLPEVGPSLDTVQEAFNVASQAKKRGVKTLLCISNRLQLLQVRALLRKEPLSFVWMPTRLRDWRWWYVSGRMLLIPLAFLGIGPRFAPLMFIRWARSTFAKWPF